MVDGEALCCRQCRRELWALLLLVVLRLLLLLVLLWLAGWLRRQSVSRQWLGRWLWERRWLAGWVGQQVSGKRR